MDTLDIWVNPKKNVFIPNVFSPNGDGVNDIFKPFTDENVKTLKVFRIFNRWGDLIFERKNIDATTTIIDGWDGYYNGQPVQTDVYVYHIELEYKDGKVVQLYGDVTLTY
jgi:gliding motility-associated-like protein